MPTRAPRATLALVGLGLGLGLAACGGPRTVAVTLDDGRGAEVRVPAVDTPVTAVAFCTQSRADACRALGKRANELRVEGVTLVLVGVPESDDVFMTHPLRPAVTAELRAQGALYGTDAAGVARRWLAVHAGGGAVITREGEIVWREPRDVVGDALVEKSVERARRRRFVDALPGAGTVTLALVGLLVLATLVLVLIIRPRPFERLPLALNVPFVVRTRARRKRTALWLADDLALTNGGAIDSDDWPEGLGTWLDVRVTVDGRVVVHERVAVNQTGPAGLAYAAISTGRAHRATKLLLRFDSRPGAAIEISGTLTPKQATLVRRAELLVA